MQCAHRSSSQQDLKSDMCADVYVCCCRVLLMMCIVSLPLQGIQRRGMERDSTWNGAAEQYEELFEWALMDQPYA